jgi:hypothetical protein
VARAEAPLESASKLLLAAPSPAASMPASPLRPLPSPADLRREAAAEREPPPPPPLIADDETAALFSAVARVDADAPSRTSAAILEDVAAALAVLRRMREADEAACAALDAAATREAAWAPSM